MENTGAAGGNADILDTIRRQLERMAEDSPTLTEETDLTKDVDIDSASIMTLVFELEETFDVSVPLNELGDVRTIGELASLIERLRRNRG